MMKGKDYISGNHSKFLIRYGAELSRQSCRERTFLTNGYFVSSVGNVSQAAVREYIENRDDTVHDDWNIFHPLN